MGRREQPAAENDGVPSAPGPVRPGCLAEGAGLAWRQLTGALLAAT